ncbi:structural molecules [Striga asiatica]|uniref:Structural molecules n=1 Tax=Striga asiatica TaxID=4170 RepID=A0A5A7NX26_STRAF|nr:structural molecules [Striga asiatica]
MLTAHFPHGLAPTEKVTDVHRPHVLDPHWFHQMRKLHLLSCCYSGHLRWPRLRAAYLKLVIRCVLLIKTAGKLGGGGVAISAEVVPYLLNAVFASVSIADYRPTPIWTFELEFHNGKGSSPEENEKWKLSLSAFDEPDNQNVGIRYDSQEYHYVTALVSSVKSLFSARILLEIAPPENDQTPSILLECPLDADSDKLHT